MKYKKTIGCVCAVLLTAFLYWQDNGLMMTKMTYAGDIPQNFNGYKIMHVSDLQNKVFGRNQKPLLKKIKASAPDIIVFTGGVGENQATARWGACDGLEFMGVKLDAEKNKSRGEEIVISTEDSKVKVVVIPTDEELMIASDTMDILSK